METQEKPIVKQAHHERDQLCTTRPPYRQGKKLTAVKVYTVNDESQHLLIRGVPALNLQKEMKHLCMRYGEVKLVHQAKNYSEDEEHFTEVFHILYAKIQSARFAKHMMDDKSFFGGILHVCYAPELETLAETKHKLEQRKHDVLKRIRQYKADELRKAKFTKKRTHGFQSDDGDVDHFQATPNNHFSSFNESLAGSSGLAYTPNRFVRPVRESSKINYTPDKSSDPKPSSSGINYKPITVNSSHQISKVPSHSQKSFTEAGLISCEFIPRQTSKSDTKLDSNSTNDVLFRSSSEDKTTVKRSATVKVDNKFIPPQVKRIKFN